MWDQIGRWQCTGGWHMKTAPFCFCAHCQGAVIKRRVSTTCEPIGRGCMAPLGLRVRNCAHCRCWRTLPWTVTEWTLESAVRLCPPLRLPVRSLPHSDKHTLLVRVQVILSGEQPQREPAATQQHPSVSGVVPETPEVFPAEETSQSGQPDAAPMETEEQGEASKEGPPVQRPFSQPEGAAGQRTPPRSMSPCTSDSPPVPSPAFTILSSPSLSIDLTTTGLLLASPIFPPCSSPRPERDPVLAQPSPVGPPQVTRSLWDEFTPVTLSRTLPPAVNIPPERRAASATVTSDVPDRDALLAQLREVDGQRLTLDVARSNLIRELAVLEGETLRATRLELEASQQRCQLLEDQLRHYPSTAEPSLQVVGDLQGICSSHALLLLPDQGRTSVYHLTQEDLLSLDISGRDSALSCERL